jgi:hypothetical protein
LRATCTSTASHIGGRTLDELLETKRATFDPRVADEADSWATDAFHRWFKHRAMTRSLCPAQ